MGRYESPRWRVTPSAPTRPTDLALRGQYTASSFALSSDFHGGTSVIDPGVVNPVQNTLATPFHA
jgi:hypothetical protein